MEITIALAQMDIALGQPKENAATAQTLAAQASARGAGLLLLPELWPTGYDLDRIERYTTPLDGGHFALMARMDTLEANSLLSGTQARLSAEAAINLAVLALRDPDDETRMRADGRVYSQVLDGVVVEVSAIDERGKLDINASDELSLVNLFTGHGMELTDAEFLAAAVLDWRDEDELERVNGAEEDA